MVILVVKNELISQFIIKLLMYNEIYIHIYNLLMLIGSNKYALVCSIMDANAESILGT